MMNPNSHPDLLAHQYRPQKDVDIICHQSQALELKLWIKDFLLRSSRRESDNSNRNSKKQKIYSEDSYSCSMNGSESLPSCILLSGPPGVGKTSMVYAIANQLKLHVVECHASEKRDSKSISRLKLANQKQHINRQIKVGTLNGFFSSSINGTTVNATTQNGSTEDDDSNERDDHCLLLETSSKKGPYGTPLSCKKNGKKSGLNVRNKRGRKKESNTTQRSMFDFIQKDSSKHDQQDGNRTINILSDDELEIVGEKKQNKNGHRTAAQSPTTHDHAQRLNKNFTPFGDFIELDQPQSSKSLSVSTTSSIILFDDVDVLFEDDGQFWSSLIPFIETSQRPVIMTATQSIDKIKELFPRCRIISLERPEKDKLSELLLGVCNREGFNQSKFLHQNDENCEQLIYNYPCDIRRCLNQIHFYRGLSGIKSEADHSIHPAFHSFDLGDLGSSNDVISLRTTNNDLFLLYDTLIITDVLKTRIDPSNRDSVVQSWIEGKPTSFRGEEYSSIKELGEDIQDTITNLSRDLFKDRLLDYDKYRSTREVYQTARIQTSKAYELFNTSIKGRAESFEADFKTDIAPFLASIIQSEKLRNEQNSTTNARRIKRFLHYLDTIEVYLDDKEILADTISNFGAASSLICDILLDVKNESQIINHINYNVINCDNEDTYEYFNIESDSEELPIYNSRKRVKVISDDTC